MTNLDSRTSLPLLQTSDSGCSCCSTSTTSAPAATTPDTAPDGTTASFDVTGMTCHHCVVAVTEEISAIPGVTDVTVDLVPGATSRVRVTTTADVTRTQIAAALDDAGDYHLTTN